MTSTLRYLGRIPSDDGGWSMSLRMLDDLTPCQTVRLLVPADALVDVGEDDERVWRLAASDASALLATALADGRIPTSTPEHAYEVEVARRLPVAELDPFLRTPLAAGEAV